MGDLPRKKIRLLLSYKCASKAKEKENPDQRSEGSKNNKRKFPVKDWMKAKEKRKCSIKGWKKTKEIYRKVFEPNNMWTNIQNCHKQVRKERKSRLVTHEVVPSLSLPTKILCARNSFTPH